jgi:hypothetical protein
MPGGLDFGKGLVDVNFQMWPLFCCLSLDNILTCCEIALSPTGRVLFISRHPAMLGIAVSTIKYLVELRGWNGISLPAVHSRDAKIYLEDPGPWILGLATEARYLARTAPEVCICDLYVFPPFSYSFTDPFFAETSTTSTVSLHHQDTSLPNPVETDTVESSSLHLTRISILIIRSLRNSKRLSLLGGSDPSPRFRVDAARTVVLARRRFTLLIGGISRGSLVPLMRSYRIGYVF